MFLACHINLCFSPITIVWLKTMFSMCHINTFCFPSKNNFLTKSYFVVCHINMFLSAKTWLSQNTHIVRMWGVSAGPCLSPQKRNFSEKQSLCLCGGRAHRGPFSAGKTTVQLCVTNFRWVSDKSLVVDKCSTDIWWSTNVRRIFDDLLTNS